MAKRIGGVLVEQTVTEWAVEWEHSDSGETFVTECDDDEHARLIRASLNGKLLVREVHIMPWTDARSLEDHT